MRELPKDDPEVASLVKREELRIGSTLDLIAAENHAPTSIREALGSIFSTKSAEGYPGNRFHSGCAYVDKLENLAISRAKELFSAEHANVQPNSGVCANLAVYTSVLHVGDRVLAMKLSHGGHLSHGDPASMTSKCFNFAHYSVNRDTELIDYGEIQELALKFKPKMIVAGASSYSRLIDYKEISQISKQISAYFMVDMAHIAGLVAAKAIPSPVPHSDFVTFTTYKTLRGGRGGVILSKREYAKKIDKGVFPGVQGTSAFNSIAAKAVCFKLAMDPQFIQTQRNILGNAKSLADALKKRGFRIVHGGTENHIVLIDLRSKGIKGNEAEETLESIGILANRNVIPYDPENPMITSGLRFGVSGITTRGMGDTEMVQISEIINSALSNKAQRDVLDRLRGEVLGLCRRFPLSSITEEADL